MLTSVARFLGLALAALVGLPTFAQEFPSKTITLVVPFPPGAGIDVVARVVGQELSPRLGQPVIVENKPGVGGLQGARIVARAPADGHTLLVAPNTVVLSPHVLSKDAVTVDVLKELVPVINVGNNSMVLAVNPQLGVTKLSDLVDLAKRQPGTPYASGGNGSPMHIVGELFKKRAAIDLVHVPYKGVVPSINDVVGGQVKILWAPWAGAATFIRNGRLRAIALADTERSPSAPELPTMAELGYPDVVSRSWAGILAPAGTPQRVISLLNREINEILVQAVPRGKVTAVGYDIVGGTPERFASEMRGDYDRYGQLVAELRIRGD